MPKGLPYRIKIVGLPFARAIDGFIRNYPIETSLFMVFVLLGRGFTSSRLVSLEALVEANMHDHLGMHR